jgi:hypothetical protein
VLVNYATIGQHGKIRASDYTGKTDGELIFLAGELEKNIVVPIKGDAVLRAGRKIPLSCC